MQVSTSIDSSTVAILQTGQPTNRAVASAGANWTPVVVGAQIVLAGSILYHNVAAVYAPGTSGNFTTDRWELVISGVFTEPAAAAATYAIDIDFYSVTKMWMPMLRDTMTLQFLRRNFDIINNLLSNVTSIASGSIALTNGQQTYQITGIPAQSLVGGIYVFRVICSFENTVDSSPTVVNYIVTIKTSTTCTISFNPRPSNANTIMRFAVFAT